MNYRLVHFITVGTSIPRNFSSILGRCHDFPEECPIKIEHREIAEHLQILMKCLSIPPGSPSEIECINSLGGWGSLQNHILDALRWDHKRMSAELNAMNPWIEYAHSRDPDYVAGVYLYVTETGSGILAGKVLKRYLEEKLPHASIEYRTIQGMRENLWQALRSLSMAIGSDVRNTISRGEDEVVMLNLTGGLKPEGAIALLEVARRPQAKAVAYYIHEIHRKPTPIPVIVSDSFILEARNLLKKRLQSQERMIKVPVNELDDYTKWLHYFAAAIEPLGLARIGKDSILLDVDIARMIVQAEK